MTDVLPVPLDLRIRLGHKFLDNGSRDYGYAVFGRVTEGMDTVDKIAAVKTGRRKGYQDAPMEDVVIISATTVGDK